MCVDIHIGKNIVLTENIRNLKPRDEMVKKCESAIAIDEYHNPMS